MHIEFPMLILCSYNGASNLDVTIDDNLVYLLGKHFHDNKLNFKIEEVKLVEPTPGENDELVRFEVEMDIGEFESEFIRKELEYQGFEKGLTIKLTNGKTLFADNHTSDIPLRRSLNKSGETFYNMR